MSRVIERLIDCAFIIWNAAAGGYLIAMSIGVDRPPMALGFSATALSLLLIIDQRRTPPANDRSRP